MADQTQNSYFEQNPDVAAAYEQNPYGLTPEQFAQTHFERFGSNEGRVDPLTLAPAPAPAVAPAPIVAELPYTPSEPSGALSQVAAPNYDQLIRDAYGSIGRGLPDLTGGFTVGGQRHQIDQAGYDYWLNQLETGGSTPEAFQRNFETAVNAQLENDPNNLVSRYVSRYRGEDVDALPTISDYRGQSFETDQLTSLASQILANTDLRNVSGGAYGSSGQSIGFGYEDLADLLGRDVRPYEQVAFDMARNLMQKGVTDLSQITTENLRQDMPVQLHNYDDGTVRFSIQAPNPTTGEVEFRWLTPEEEARIETNIVDDAAGGGYQQRVLKDYDVGYGLNLPSGQLTTGVSGQSLSVPIGSSYTGPGGTYYYLNYDPATGRPTFNTVGASTSDADFVAPLLAVASFIPGVAPFAQGLNAILAASQGNYVGAALSALDSYGSSLGSDLATAADVSSANAVNGLDLASDLATTGSTTAGTLANVNLAQTGIGALNALRTGNVAGLLSAAGSLSGSAGLQLPADVKSAVNLVSIASALDRGDFAGALNSASSLTGSENPRIAAQAFNIISGIQSGDFSRIVSGIKGIDNLVGRARTTPATSGATNTTASSAEAGDDGYTAYATAINAGATEDEAMELANTISGTQLASADAGTRSDAGDGATVEVSGVPIFAESREAANVRPPPGYELMSSSEMDARPSGAYYDNMLNAWLKPTGAFDLSFSPDDAASFDAGSLDSADIDAVGSDAYAGPYGGAGEEGFAPDTTVADTAYIDGGQGGAADQGDEEGMAPVTTVTDTPYVEEVQDEIPSEEEEGTAPETTVTDTPYVEEVQDEIVNEEEVATPPTTPAPPSRPPSPTTAPAPAPLPSVAPRVVIPTLTSMGFSEAEAASLAAQMLESKETQKALDPLAKVKEAQKELEREIMMQNRDPRLMEMLSKQSQFQKDEPLGIEDQQYEQDGSYYSYGSEQSIDDILNGSKQPAYKSGGYVAPLMAHGGMALPLLAKSGGALSQSTRGGREDFKDGKHVAGDGDGQSDDIPAWLADGEFVFPADVVSALGNGSTKAGTDKLYEMMHSIRDRARSKGSKDLPPPALKSPLDYLKSAKRSAR